MTALIPIYQNHMGQENTDTPIFTGIHPPAKTIGQTSDLPANAQRRYKHLAMLYSFAFLFAAGTLQELLIDPIYQNEHT